MSINGLFENAMTDVSGKIRLESEDPRWIQLFSSKCIPTLVDTVDLVSYGNRLIEHNPVTGNLVQLLEQTANRLQQVLSRKSAPASQQLEQCCLSLRLSTLIMHHFIISVPYHKLAKQLFLTDAWYDHDSTFGRNSQSGSRSGVDSRSEGAGIAQGSRVLEFLIQEVAAAIDSPFSNLWLRDVKFFCVDLLLCLCSTQLYASHHQYDRGGVQIVSFNSDADIFLNYIFGKAEKQLRGVLGSMQSSSSAFSNCLAVQLVRGLLLAGTHSADFVAATSSKSGSNTGSSSSGAVSSVWLRSAVPTAASKVADTAGTYPRSQLLEKLAERYRPVGSGATAGDSSTAVATSSTVTGAGAGSDGGGVASIILGMWKYLPFGALHRLFALQAPPDPAGQSTQYLEQHQHQHQPSSLSMPVAVAVENALSLPANPLAERSLDLLLILLHNRRSPFVKKANPFREVFGLLHDRTIDVGSLQEEDEEGGGGASLEFFASRDIRSASLSSNGSSVGGDALGNRSSVLMQGQGGRGAAGSSSSQLLLDASHIHVSFLQLVDALGRGLPEESSALLLYSLLQAHPTFLEALISADALEHVLMSCMRGLYALTAKTSKRLSTASGKTMMANLPLPECAKSINQLYVLVVCILMIVQDSAVTQELHKQHIVAMSWYKERPLHSATLMDASLLCLLRCLMHSLFRLQDEYLVSNSCAILHNLAASLTTGMLPYTAERLVRVTCQLCSRAVRACEARVMRGDRAAATAVAGAGSGNQPQPQRVPMFDPRNLNVNGTIVAAASSSDLSLASETDPRYSAAGADLREATLLPSAVSALLALLFTALRKERLTQNVHLLYALMHDSHTVEALFAHPAVTEILAASGLPSDLGDAILRITRFYLGSVEVLGGENQEGSMSAAQTVEFLIGEISKENNGDFAHTTPSVSSATATATVQKIERKKYTYQEAENPEEFFLPCVWTCTVRNSPEVPWQLLQTTLIDPLAAGFIRLQDQNPIAVTAVPLASALEDATENSMHASSMTNIQDQV